MASNEELKNIIIELKMDLINAKIPNGNCPYAYYNIKNPVDCCNDVGCRECKDIFLNEMRSKIEAEVAQL